MNLTEQLRIKRSAWTYFHKHLLGCEKKERSPWGTALTEGDWESYVFWGKVFSSIKAKKRREAVQQIKDAFTMQVRYQMQFALFYLTISYRKTLWMVYHPKINNSSKMLIWYGNNDNNGITKSSTSYEIRSFLQLRRIVHRGWFHWCEIPKQVKITNSDL
jgi:hypothetical protein